MPGIIRISNIFNISCFFNLKIYVVPTMYIRELIQKNGFLKLDERFEIS